ncbi:MAG TPA: pinensin family lanthipeptide [Saprospiraceae bacterium]|nr:pinensin family lanthipeptide [Saprospiraceae bacterium]
MAKEKLKLSDLKVQSFVTALDEDQMNRLKGGYVIKGRRFNYRTRWTMVDTRSDVAFDQPSSSVSAG